MPFHPTPLVSIAPDQRLHVIVVVSNPVRYRSRIALYERFAEKIQQPAEVNLITVEAAFGQRDYTVTQAGNPNHVQLRIYDELWHKENLINIGIQHLSRQVPNWQYVAWIDADIEFVRPDWAFETIQALQHYHIVQPWCSCIDLGPDGQALEVHRSFLSVYIEKGLAALQAGNLGYGPNPKLTDRIKSADLILAVGARLGEATTDSYTLVTPDHPGKTLIHVHPDPNELGHVYRADLAICAGMPEFARAAARLPKPQAPKPAGAEAHAEWKAWNTPAPFDTRVDLGMCVAAMREALPADTIICNGAGNFSGWWHRYWSHPKHGTQLAPTAGAMGYGPPAAVAAALRHPGRSVVALAGDGDFMMNGQELATAVQYGCDLLVVLVDNGTYGTIRMHQEREFPGRVVGTTLRNPDFTALAAAYGGWAQRVETTAQFEAALAEARDRKGLRLIHALIDPEQLSAGGATISGLRAKAKG